MKILFIAPIPPPTNGMSLASEVLFNRLKENGHQLFLVDMAKKKRPTNIWHHIQRSIEVFNFLLKTATKKRKAELIYFTLSESIFGNIKDLFIYSLCSGKLSKMYVHMLGGAGMKSILDRRGLLFRLNKYFITKVKGVIVEGRAQKETFSQIADPEKIAIVPNFAEDFLFVDEEDVRRKFESTQPIKILYLSNLIYGKGFNELADAYIALKPELKEQIQITFVGGFQSDVHKEEFLAKINDEKGIIYHGRFAAGETKKGLYQDSHIFCLPTYYPYEGQPISILEAYATGCVVITTYHSGIPEVFTDQVNGFRVEKKSAESISAVLNKICQNPDSLINIALLNRETAFRKYRTSIYGASLEKILQITN